MQHCSRVIGLCACLACTQAQHVDACSKEDSSAVLWPVMGLEAAQPSWDHSAQCGSSVSFFVTCRMWLTCLTG